MGLLHCFCLSHFSVFPQYYTGIVSDPENTRHLQLIQFHPFVCRIPPPIGPVCGGFFWGSLWILCGSTRWCTVSLSKNHSRWINNRARCRRLFESFHAWREATQKFKIYSFFSSFNVTTGPEGVSGPVFTSATRNDSFNYRPTLFHRLTEQRAFISSSCPKCCIMTRVFWFYV